MNCRVSLIELETAGHRLWYLKLLAGRLAERPDVDGIDIFVKQGGASSPEWQVQLADSRDCVVHEVAPGSLSRSALLRRASAAATRIVIPDGDLWLPAVTGTAGVTSISLLVSRPFPANGLVQRLRWSTKMGLALAATARGSTRVFRLAMSEHETRPPSRLGWLPDPVELTNVLTGGEARRHLGLAEGLDVSLLCGGLGERKSVSHIVDAWRKVRNPDCRLVFVGSCQDTSVLRTLTDLQATDDRVVLRLEYVSNLEFDTWISAADRTLSLYDNVGSSGVALKSWAAGTAVVVRRGSYLAEQLSNLHASMDAVRSDAELTQSLAGVRAPNDGQRPTMAQLRRRTAAFTDGLIGRL